MLYLITFVEGLISFLSPCFLPLLPVYLAYFAGDADGGQDDRRTLAHAGLFVLGFSLVFILLGVGAGAVGALLLLVYSLGMGLPLLLSALLVARLKGAFDAVKRHYQLLNRIAGGFLIITGVCMMLGLLDALLAVLA